jgi:hypothetical protein
MLISCLARLVDFTNLKRRRMFLAESTTNREKRRRMLSSHSYLAVRFYERLSLIFDRENGTPPVSTVTPTETVWVNENGTRVRTHSERRLAESLQLLPSILVDCVEHLRYFENLLDLRIVGAASFQAPRPAARPVQSSGGPQRRTREVPLNLFRWKNLERSHPCFPLRPHIGYHRMRP